MKLKLTTQYKSLAPFESEELNDFTIITGKNGSGKTQLVNLIRYVDSTRSSQDVPTLIVTPKICRVQYEGIIPTRLSKVTHSDWSNILNQKTQNYYRCRKRYLLYSYLVNKKLLDDFLKTYNVERQELFLEDAEYKSLLYEAYIEVKYLGKGIERMLEPKTDTITLKMEHIVIKHMFEKLKELLPFFKMADKVCMYTGKSGRKISDGDFYNTPLESCFFDQNELFGSQIGIIFYNYAQSRDLNQRRFFEKEKYGDSNNAVPDDEFIKSNIPPWETLNAIFKKHRINFFFEAIDRRSFNPSVPIEVKLVSESTKVAIPFTNLSSGEQVIIGLIIKLFTSYYYEKDLIFPDLLVLDEPDAHLHPEMSKLLLEVLNKTFVEDLKIKVVITTHSPSTIALAPEKSLFQLSNGVSTSLKRIKKDQALKILTENIPTLSIDYRSHRQIFVESPTDLKFYQTIFDKLSEFTTYTHRLYFISNSLGNGNCDQVVETTKQLRKSGNKTCFGIIDWDLKNKSQDYILVHGEGSVYSIENYLYNPLFMAILFMEQEGANNIYEIDFLGRSYSPYSLGNESTERLQTLVDWYFQKLLDSPAFREYKSKTEKNELKFCGGNSIQIFKWYTEHQGHKLEKKLTVVFKSLQSFTKKGEGKLQEALTYIIAKTPELIPLDTKNIMDRLAIIKK